MEPSDPATIYEVILVSAYVFLAFGFAAAGVVWGLVKLAIWLKGITWRT